MTEQTQEHRLQQSNFISSNSQGKGMKLINPSGEGVFRSRTLLFRDKRWFKIRSEGRIRCCSLFCSLNLKPTIRKWNSWNHLGKPFKTIPNHYLKKQQQNKTVLWCDDNMGKVDHVWVKTTTLFVLSSSYSQCHKGPQPSTSTVFPWTLLLHQNVSGLLPLFWL